MFMDKGSIRVWISMDKGSIRIWMSIEKEV